MCAPKVTGGEKGMRWPVEDKGQGRRRWRGKDEGGSERVVGATAGRGAASRAPATPEPDNPIRCVDLVSNDLVTASLDALFG